MTGGVTAPPVEAQEDLAELLNRECRCISMDPEGLRRELESDGTNAGLYRFVLETRPNLFSPTAVFVSCVHAARMAQIIQAVEAVVALPAYREQVLAWAPAIARHDPGPLGVFLGYDFHLGPTGPQLIEINTNAGGALLSAALARAQQACCRQVRTLAVGPVALTALEGAFHEMFRAEWRRQRGGQPLRRVAIVDDDPGGQYLHPEFLLFQQLFRRHGLECVIADPRALSLGDGALRHDGLAIDLVYNRLTDFSLDLPGHESLREAYLSGAVVATPHPRAHALYADKRNLTLLTDPGRLRAWGLPEAVVGTLLGGIPRTVRVDPGRAEALWADRRRLFFKPAAGYGSKAAYRGDKLTRRAWADILAGEYVAQGLVPPSERRLRLAEEDITLKVDVRNFVYDGAVQFLSARLYQGQTTNLRTRGGGLAPVFCPEPLAPDGMGP